MCFISQNIHKNLEEKIARFHQREDAILYISCFDANAGLFEVGYCFDLFLSCRKKMHFSTLSPVRAPVELSLIC